jgi:hypothetical protein
MTLKVISGTVATNEFALTLQSRLGVTKGWWNISQNFGRETAVPV